MCDENVNRILAIKQEELCENCQHYWEHLVLRYDNRGRSFYKKSLCELEMYPSRHHERSEIVRSYYQCDEFCLRENALDVVDIRDE